MTRRLLHPTVPFKLGSKAVGRVIECGSEVSSIQVGDVVHAFTWHGSDQQRLQRFAQEAKAATKALAA